MPWYGILIIGIAIGAVATAMLGHYRPPKK